MNLTVLITYTSSNKWTLSRISQIRQANVILRSDSLETTIDSVQSLDSRNAKSIFTYRAIGPSTFRSSAEKLSKYPQLQPRHTRKPYTAWQVSNAPKCKNVASTSSQTRSWAAISRIVTFGLGPAVARRNWACRRGAAAQPRTNKSRFAPAAEVNPLIECRVIDGRRPVNRAIQLFCSVVLFPTFRGELASSRGSLISFGGSGVARSSDWLLLLWRACWQNIRAAVAASLNCN